jgi:hypothetical protein
LHPNSDTIVNQVLFDVILDSRKMHFTLIKSMTNAPCVLQTFNTLIVSRFQSINPNKDGKSVKGISDLKNEVRIITSPDETFKLWKEFLDKHSSGGLINLDTGIHVRFGTLEEVFMSYRPHGAWRTMEVLEELA